MKSTIATKFLKIAIPMNIIIMGIFSPLQAQESIRKKPSAKNQSLAKVNRNSNAFGPLNKHSVGVGLGQTVLMGNVSNHGENRITLDGYYNYSASHSFELLINAHYSKHEYKREKVVLPGLTAAIKAKVFQFDSFSPFGFAGLGFYRPQATRYVNNLLVSSEKQWTFGTNFGAGADLRLNQKFTFGLIAHYHNPFDVKQEVGNEVEGSYFKVLLTTMYTF